MGSGKGKNKRVKMTGDAENINKKNPRGELMTFPCVHCGIKNDFYTDDTTGYSDFVYGMLSYARCDYCHKKEEEEEAARKNTEVKYVTPGQKRKQAQELSDDQTT